MSLAEDIKKYVPMNEQEANDKKQMLQFINDFQNYLERENQVGHFTASMWVVNKERTKTLMIYHNIYNAWSWIGGHADGMEDLCEVACKELQEETGIRNMTLSLTRYFQYRDDPGERTREERKMGSESLAF